MFEKFELVGKLNKELKGRGKTYIGYDLGAGYGEISVFREQDAAPATLLSRKDATVFHFPNTLVKYNGRFYAGFEAEALTEEAEALVFRDVLELAMDQPTVVVGGQRFSTDYLLGLFLKLTLLLPEEYGKTEKAGAIMFTTYVDEDPALQTKVFQVLSAATAQLFGKRTRLYLQTRSESIYYFLMYQEESLLCKETLVCDYQRDYLKSYLIRRQGKKAPYMILTERIDYPDMKYELPRGIQAPAQTTAGRSSKEQGSRVELRPRIESLDDKLDQVIADIEAKQDFELAYMVGDGFKGGWMDESLNRLCRHGRVFQGNNLYSQGACYGLMHMLNPSEIVEEHIFMGKEDIPYSVGLFRYAQGFMQDTPQPEYYEIFPFGQRYTQCRKCLYLLPQGEENLQLYARGLSEESNKILSVSIRRFPHRNAGESRIKCELEFADVHTLRVTVTDIGLGEAAPGSGQSVSETFLLE